MTSTPTHDPAIQSSQNVVHYNTFTGNIIDRLHTRRKDETYLTQLLHSDKTRFLPFFKLNPLLTRTSIAWVSRQALPQDTDLNEVVLLGCEPNTEAPLYALSVAAADPFETSASEETTTAPEVRKFVDLRRSLAGLSAPDAGLLAQARALLEWHANKFCARCGGPTKLIEGGDKRKCLRPAPERQHSRTETNSNKSEQKKAAVISGVENKSAPNVDNPKLLAQQPTAGSSDTALFCGASFYPRVDSVAIMCVVHPDGDQILLGRKSIFPKNMYSCLAGFIAPGESVEEAVRRETKEESGVEVDKVTYFSSQPWPFGGQLMVGCHAFATSPEIARGDDELEDVRWFTLQEVQQMVEESLESESFFTSTKLRTAPPSAIAFKLIQGWIQTRLGQ